MKLPAAGVNYYRTLSEKVIYNYYLVKNFPHQKPPFRAVFVESLSLYLLELNTLAQRRIELYKFNLARNGLFILASPNNVIGFRGFEPKQAVL